MYLTLIGIMFAANINMTVTCPTPYPLSFQHHLMSTCICLGTTHPCNWPHYAGLWV